MRRAPFFVLVSAAALAFTGVANAQMGMPGAGGQRQQAPTQSGPTQQRTVGPRAGQSNADDEDNTPSVQRAGEPLTAPPANPLEIPDEVRARIGSDADDQHPPAPMGDMHRSFFPYYEEQRGDYRLRLLPPLWLEHVRGLPTAHPSYGEPKQQDRQSLYGLFFYQRRSPDIDADVLFPALWHIRDHDSETFALGPLAHREAPNEHDNWVAPLFFEGARKDGGYFHSLPLLTTMHASAEKAFHLTLLYFRDRRGTDVDWGVAPFYFSGDNGNKDGARKTYELVPPLFYYHRHTEIDETDFRVAGPLIWRSDPKRSVFDVAPLYFHISGHPETGGVHESHTTLFPLFHYGYKEDETLFVIPGYMRRTSKTIDTLLTPLYSHATTRSGSTSLTAIGPIVPLVWHYRDKDIDQTTDAVLPLVYHSISPKGVDWLTPVFGRFEEYGVSKTYWLAPTFLVTTDTHGWEADFLPIAWVGRSDHTSHTVLAPLLWDFATEKGRTTIAAPLFWRFADSTDDSITQVAGNTLFLQKRVAGGLDWQFHVLPFVSYGEMPNGHWWNFLGGLAGYSHETDGSKTVRALWIPIPVGGPDKPAAQAASNHEAGKF